MSGHLAQPVPVRVARRRIASRVLLCLGAGALINILIAAACLMYAPTSMTSRGGGVSQNITGRAPYSVALENRDLYSGFGVCEMMEYWCWVPEQRPGRVSVVGAGVQAARCGWPLFALSSPRPPFPASCDQAGWDAAVKAAYARPTTDKVLPAFLKAKPYRALPTRVMPLGFVVNTFLYGSLIGAMTFGVTWLRRLLRRRASCCEHCGYPVPGLDRCPECGRAVRSRLRAAMAAARRRLARLVPTTLPEPTP